MEILKGDVFTKLQPVKLTKEEIADQGDALAKSNLDLAQAEKNKKSAVAQFTSTIAGFEADIEKHSMFITTKEEWRDVECQWQFNFDKGTKNLVRLDTSEILESQIKVNDHDRQQMLKIAPVKKDGE